MPVPLLGCPAARGRLTPLPLSLPLRVSFVRTPIRVEQTIIAITASPEPLLLPTAVHLCMSPHGYLRIQIPICLCLSVSTQLCLYISISVSVLINPYFCVSASTFLSLSLYLPISVYLCPYICRFSLSNLLTFSFFSLSVSISLYRLFPEITSDTCRVTEHSCCVLFSVEFSLFWAVCSPPPRPGCPAVIHW